ncbi:hypothetical protein TNCT_734831 [Trichonephila clavata]|uniref:Beta-mannosidase-like galactose-binding domain-containing protein n=1 Tax=Trichonephila clavata TaxID=2740835 RepID=A0A8X6FVM1_TRICU|nr:hypothetical protein TNCT_734831 [Trichonephila clavata]
MGIVVKSKVPGSIHSDLRSNNVIQDPYFGENDVLYRWIGLDSWTFSKNFKGWFLRNMIFYYVSDTCSFS